MTPLPPELRELLRQRLGSLETQLLRKVAELEEEKSQLYNETAAHRQRTESALNSLLERITELEKSKRYNWHTITPVFPARHLYFFVIQI